MNDFLKQIEEDAGWVIEQELGRKAVIIFEDGEEQTKSALEPAEDLKCGFFQESREVDSATGYEIISDKPVAVFRRKALIRMPQPNKRVLVKVQISAFSEDLTTYQIAGPPKSGKTIGYINFSLQSVSQS